MIATDDLGADPITKDEVYRSLFDLEAIFRQLKSTLKVGPIRHRRADRIPGHVMVAVMARNVAAWLEHESGMTCEALRAELEPFRVQEVVLGAERYWQCVEPTPAQVKLIRGLGFSLPPTRFTVTPAR